MPPTAIIIVDAHQDLTDTKISNINALVEWAGSNGEMLFYLLPEGAELHPDVSEADVCSILRYAPDSDNPYRQGRIDEQMQGRGIEEVQLYGPGTKPGDFAERERGRGRSAYAGPPEHSDAPAWAGPPQ